MPRNKRVFPFFLDGGIQTVDQLPDTWDGTSSFIEVTDGATGTLTVGITDSYGKPIPHGAMLVVKKTTSTYSDLTIDPSADFNTSDDTTVLKGVGSMALFMFKGPSTTNDKGEWVEITKVTDVDVKSFFNAIVSGDLSVLGDLNVSKILSSGDAPTAAVTSTSGTCTVSANSTDTAIKLTFGGTWVSAETATITFASAYTEPPVIATNIDPNINGSFSVNANGLTFTATGTCANDADIVLIGIKA